MTIKNAKGDTKIRMQVLGSSYGFKVVKTLLLTFFMHFYNKLWSPHEVGYIWQNIYFFAFKLRMF